MYKTMYELPATALLFSESRKNKSGLSYTRDIKLFVVQHLQIHRLPFVGKYMYWKCSKCVYWTAHLQSRQLTPWVLSTLAISTVCHSEATKAQKLHMLQLWIEKKRFEFPHIYTYCVLTAEMAVNLIRWWWRRSYLWVHWDTFYPLHI